MRQEVPVMNPDGAISSALADLVQRLHQEAESGELRVNLYRGPVELGSEAFYTLSDGTVLHEVNGTAEDGSDYRYLALVLDEPDAKPRSFRRTGYPLRPGKLAGYLR